jgi:hypothetical protein
MGRFGLPRTLPAKPCGRPAGALSHPPRSIRHGERRTITKEDAMQYALLIYQGTTPVPTDPEAWATLSPEEQQQIYADYATIGKTPGVQPGLPLGLPDKARTVRVEGGAAVTTEGAFLGKEGAVGGYFVVDADDLDAAVALAARIPAARHGGAIEVRPIETYW